MKLKFSKPKRENFKNIPFIFERYEIFVIIIGIFVVSLIAGFLFYEKAYKTVTTTPEFTETVSEINDKLFKKTGEELEQRKEMAPDLPIIDPFK